MKKILSIILLSFLLMGCISQKPESVILDDSTLPYELVEENNVKVSVQSVKEKNGSIEVKLYYENNTGHTVVIVPGSITLESSETVILPIPTSKVEDGYEFNCSVFDMENYDGIVNENGTIEVNEETIQLEKLVEYQGSVVSLDDNFGLK